MKHKELITTILILVALSTQSQDLKNINPSLLSGSWNASFLVEKSGQTAVRAVSKKSIAVGENAGGLVHLP